MKKMQKREKAIDSQNGTEQHDIALQLLPPGFSAVK